MTMQGDELRAVRKGLGWTQQQLADELGMSRKAIVEMEAGRAPIERRTALAVLGVRYKAAGICPDCLGWGKRGVAYPLSETPPEAPACQTCGGTGRVVTP